MLKWEEDVKLKEREEWRGENEKESGREIH